MLSSLLKGEAWSTRAPVEVWTGLHVSPTTQLLVALVFMRSTGQLEAPGAHTVSKMAVVAMGVLWWLSLTRGSLGSTGLICTISAHLTTCVTPGESFSLCS